MKNTQNNFVAGVFTLVGIVGFVFIILTLSGASAFMQKRADYTVRFRLSDGASGLKNGSAVRVGGQEAGKVRFVEFAPRGVAKEGQGAAPEFVDVHVSIKREVLLYKDASVLLELPLLGNVSSINIPSVGTAGAGVLAEGSMIDGQIAPPAFLRQAGFGEEQRRALQNILDNGKQVSEDLKQITGAISGKAGTTMENVNAAAADVRQVAADARARIGEWSPRVDATLRSVEAFSGKMESSRALLDAGLEKARDFIASVQEALNANRGRIDSTIRNVDELTAKANTELYQRVMGTLEDAQRGVKSFSMATEAAGNLVGELSPEARLTMANARLASDQLKLMLTEVRRNPWRLLYQPGAKELERELVYDAARNYAQAVSDLRGVSASLEAAAAAMSKQSPTEADRARVAEVQKRLAESFARYRAAEQKFLDMIVKGP